jgi:hypothetical protein
MFSICYKVEIFYIIHTFFEHIQLVLVREARAEFALFKLAPSDLFNCNDSVLRSN